MKRPLTELVTEFIARIEQPPNSRAGLEADLLLLDIARSDEPPIGALFDLLPEGARAAALLIILRLLAGQPAAPCF